MRTNELHTCLRKYDPDHGIKDYYTGVILRLADKLGEHDQVAERLETVTSTVILLEIYEELTMRVEGGGNGKRSPNL